MDIRCAECASNRPKRLAASCAARILPAVFLFAALHGWTMGLTALPCRWPHLLLGGACAALLSLKYGGEKAGIIAKVVALCAAAAAFALLPAVRTGAAAALNALFSASEAVNRYAYIRMELPVSADLAACEAAFLSWLTFSEAAIAALIAGCEKRSGPLLAAVSAVFVEVYFGVVPPAVPQLMLFGCLGALLAGVPAQNGSWTDLIFAAAALLVIGWMVGSLMPGVHPALETGSERIRDWLSQQLSGETSAAVPEDVSLNRMRQESLLTEENAEETPDDAANARLYERQLKFRREISDPHPVNYFKTVLLFLLIVLLLVGPFMPFLWFDRQKRRAAALRERLDAAAPSEAVAALFRQVVRCLTAYGAKPDPRGFSGMSGRDAPPLPPEYWDAYCGGVALWQEAAYSDHPMTEAQKEEMAALLNRTRRLVWERAGRRLRFRLQYIDGLVFAEDLE